MPTMAKCNHLIVDNPQLIDQIINVDIDDGGMLYAVYVKYGYYNENTTPWHTHTAEMCVQREMKHMTCLGEHWLLAHLFEAVEHEAVWHISKVPGTGDY